MLVIFISGMPRHKYGIVLFGSCVGRAFTISSRISGRLSSTQVEQLAALVRAVSCPAQRAGLGALDMRATEGMRMFVNYHDRDLHSMQQAGCRQEG
jgi:hypothetical protein